MPTPPRSRSRRAPTCSSPAPRPSRAGRMPMPAISGGCAAPDMGEGRPLTSAPADPLPDAADDTLPLDDTIEPGTRLIRLPADKGLSLGDRIDNHITRLTWRPPPPDRQRAVWGKSVPVGV